MIKVYKHLPEGVHSSQVHQNKFPAGELRINVGDCSRCTCVQIEVKFQTNEDLVALMTVSNAVWQTILLGCKVELILAYVPYDRQDRVCNPGEAFSLVELCSLINNMEFDSVRIADPHSEASTGMLDSVQVTTQADIWVPVLQNLKLEQDFVICSPDKGARLKSEGIAEALNVRYIQADKTRKLSTGKIIEFNVKAEEVQGTVVIVDDICDGGGTFIGLAQELKKLGADKVILMCTHGVFSKGLTGLFTYIDEIHTTDSLTYADSFRGVNGLIVHTLDLNSSVVPTT